MAKQMLKRKDGSTSQRGLWDNIRANKGSGKKPTAAMLKQERKIKAHPKKAQTGISVTEGKRGYSYTKKVNTSDGPRYYRGESPDFNMAESIANFKIRSKSPDSTRKATINSSELKKMDEMKKGGSIKKKSIIKKSIKRK